MNTSPSGTISATRDRTHISGGKGAPEIALDNLPPLEGRDAIHNLFHVMVTATARAPTFWAWSETGCDWLALCTSHPGRQ